MEVCWVLVPISQTTIAKHWATLIQIQKEVSICCCVRSSWAQSMSSMTIRHSLNGGRSKNRGFIRQYGINNSHNNNNNSHNSHNSNRIDSLLNSRIVMRVLRGLADCSLIKRGM